MDRLGAISAVSGVSPAEYSPPDLVEAFTALQSLLVSTEGVDYFLEELAKLAAGIVSRPPPAGSPSTATASR